jgi:hypothetical protein
VGIEKGDPAAERSFECASASAPVLAMLVGVVNPDGSVSGAEVAQKMVYTHLVDLVPMKESKNCGCDRRVLRVTWMLLARRRYRVGRYPLWGHMYLRVWTVEQLNLIFGRGIFEMDVPFFGQLLLRTYYRLMGASIGKNVKLHRRAHLSMYDLVTIGDNACIDAASLRPLALEAGYFVLLPIVVRIAQ